MIYKNFSSHTYFLKPFSRHIEGNVTDAIISWDRIPSEFEIKKTKDKEGSTAIQQTTTIYRYILFLDLWFIKINITWKAK